MVAIENRGRPRQNGERYPSGKLKPPRGQAALERYRGLIWTPALCEAMLELVARTFGDSRIKSAVGRLLMAGELSPLQASACDLVGRRYGRYERLHGKRRSTRSPFYDGPPPGGGGAISPEAEEDINLGWWELQRVMAPLPARVRAAIETLACEDRDVGPNALAEVRRGLTHIAEKCGLAERRKATGKPNGAGEVNGHHVWRAPDARPKGLDHTVIEKAAGPVAAAAVPPPIIVPPDAPETVPPPPDRRTQALAEVPAAGFVS